ncbi:MAG: hypothetical protein ACR2Q3_10650 [Woeseiaceae bacterium]
MNWEAIGALGELIGAGAVVISLIYLAIQIRGQNSEARIAGMHAVSQGFRDGIGSLAEIPHVASVWIKSNEDLASLTDEELVQMFAVAQRNFRVWEEAFRLYRHQRLDEDIWEGITSQYVSFLAHRGFKYVWEFRREHYSKGFRDFVDNLPASDYKIRGE